MKILLFLLLYLPALLFAQEKPEEKSWWESRIDQRPDLYFPHNAHDTALKNSGLSCLACHPFSKTDEADLKTLRELSVVSNEPLEAICHSCHVVDRSAPAQCQLCHRDPKKIWPADHDVNYVELHGHDALKDEKSCQQCHLDLNYCVDCHFRRDSTTRRVHGLGYRLSHGLEARMDPQQCGSCHNPSYCFDCHRESDP